MTNFVQKRQLNIGDIHLTKKLIVVQYLNFKNGDYELTSDAFNFIESNCWVVLCNLFTFSSPIVK